MRIRKIILSLLIAACSVSITYAVCMMGAYNGWSSVDFTTANSPPGYCRNVFTGVSQGNEFLIGQTSSYATKWCNGFWVPGSANMNVVWTIGAGGANARFDGANYSQVKSYLIFVSPTNGTGDFGIMTISASPITISAVSAGTVLPQSNVSINLTLSGSKCAEEAVYVRYTTNNWTSSSFVQASGSGTAYSAVIPAMPGGTVVRYYALTTSASSGDLAANPDLLCISINNNGAANYSYTVPKTTWHTIVIDGNNDFYTNECIVTTSASSGYSNWITWDNSYFYIGYKGADIAHDASADCVLVVYISTNTNTGSAYGVKYNNQLHVLPFRADYVFNFINNYTWNSASWNGSAWNWNSPFTIITLTDLFRTGNFIEFRVSKSGLKNPAYLDVYLQMVNQAGGTEWTYGAIPNNTLTDGFKANPSNFISFKTNIWKMSKTPWSTPYKSFDPVPPISNVLLYPANNQTVYSNYSIILTNKAIDKIGIYKVEFYTNYNALYGTVYVTNYNTNYTLSISAGILKPGTNHFYTIAYDTRNLKYSATNTVIVKANNPPAKPVLTIPANGDMNFYLLKPRYKWAPVSDPDGNSVTNYQIIVSPNASLASPLFNYTIVSTASNFLTPFTNYLQNNVTYYWSVRASDGIIWGPWSDTNSFRVNPSYIKLDGSLSEWNTAVGGVNTDFITNGQWMWNDKTNDAFSTGDALPYDHLDLLKFGVTANDKCLFFMFTVPDLSDDVTYDSPRPYISVAIDTNKVSGSGVNKMVESEVGTPAASRWEMEIIANVDGTGYYTVTGVTTNFHECGENWITHTANPGLGEIAIPWEELGFSGIPETLRIVVDTGRVVDGLGIYNLQQVGGAVNFLDCVSTNNVSAADEFSDGENNVYMDIYFNTNGRIIESRFQVTCPSSALAGMPFPVVVKALAPLGGTVYDFSRAIIPQTFSGGASVIVSNTPWKNGVATNFVVINYLGSNKLIIRDAQFTNITGTSGWIVIYRPDVVVNEVMFDPSGANNDGQWIELFNRESGPIYLNGWAIHDYDGAYPMYKITNTVVLPSSNYIVLRDGAGVNDLNFTDGRGILYGEWGAGMLSVSQDEIGLYCSSTMENQYTLLDFIAYGADAGAGDDLAVTAGIWTSGAFASIANCTSNSSLVLLPDGDDNNLASDWTVDHSATPKWGNKFVILQNLSNISQSAGGYAGSIILAYQIELPDPENDTLTAGDRLSNIVICLGGTITVNNILEAKLWNDNGAGQFNYGWRNNSATNNLLLGTGVYSNTVNGFVFSNLANNLIANSPYGGKMTLYFSLKLATNAAAAQTIKPYILADSIIMQSTYPEATGPKDGALTNSAAQTVKSGYFTVNEFTDGGWAGANDYLYQFIEIYNNSSASVTPSGWNISTVQGNDNLAFYRESSFGAGQFLLIAGGGTTVQAFTNFYTENQSAPVMTSADTKIGANGLVTADTPCIIRENTTIIAIIDFTNSYTALSNTVEIIDPWGTHLPANYQASSAKHGTPGYLNGFRFIEMNLLNISNYSLDIGTTNNLILDFYIPNNNGSADTLQMITIKNNGTAIDTDITLKLWKDSASSGYDGDEALVGTFVYLGSYRWSWSGSTPVPNTGAVTKWRFFITADILAGVLDGNTVKLAIEGLTPANPAPYSHTFNTGIQLASWNDGPVDGAVSNTSYQICGVPYLTLVKTVQSIQVMSTNLALPGALLLYQISYSSLSNGRAYNVVLYDKVPLNTHYYTNYMGTAAGWTVQFSSNTSPNQGYNSADYHSNPTNALWVRWKKGLVYPSEDGRTFYLGVTID